MDKALDLLISKGVKTNIHFILSNDSIDEAINILEDEKILDGVNRLVFLLYKPIGQGVNENVLQNDDKTKYLMSLIDTEYGINKIGFDSCTVPGILNNTKIIDPKGYDPCEAGRFSAYINAQGIMVPCSFDQELKYGESINEYSIREIWKGSKFNQFRNRMKNTCTDCPKWDMCMGGCPIVPQITLCDLKFEKEKI
jgi:radical SAM protein with 4Fe4S-binding SPASM domain